LKTSGKHEQEGAHSHEHETHAHHHEAHEIHHESKKETKSDDKKIPGAHTTLILGLVIVALVVAIIYLLFIRNQSGPTPGTNETGTKDRVKVEFYVMSQCPYGTQVEDAIAPVLEKMGDAMDFQLNYIVQEEAPGKFNSLHDYCEVGGQRVSKQTIPTIAQCDAKAGIWRDYESQGDKAQLCAQKYYPADYKYMKMIICQNQNAASINTNWEACAKDLGMDTNKLRTCLNGQEGIDLLRASMQKAEARKASGSPTIYFADSSYQGQRDETSFKRAICQTSTHSACASIPACSSDADCAAQPTKEGYCLNAGLANAACEYREPAKVNLVVLNDKRCVDCIPGSAQIITQLKAIFSGLEVKELDYSSAEGKDMYKNLKIKYLPAFLFASNVKDSKGYAQISTYLIPAGDYLDLQLNVNFDPTAEICDNNIDDNGDGKVDCADESCKSQWQCMEKKDKPEVELFVMSQCPYGTQIEKGILPAVAALGSKISFAVKFCDYAMHGETEIKEELQQYCIETEQNAKYLDYLNCFLKEGKSDECATSVGIDKAKLTTCIAATDKTYSVTKNFADKTTWKGNYPPFNVFKTAVDRYGVQGSPTLVINGVIAESARDSASLLGAICTGFKVKPAECNATLSSAAPTPGFGFGAAAASTASAGGGCGV